jgi:uncharacterized protein (DUF2249 family)
MQIGQTLDVHTIAPHKRHPRIVSLSDRLRPDQAFELVSD